MFSKRAVGLDIADNTIEVVELQKQGKEFLIVNSNRVILEDGIVKRGRIKDSVKLAESLTSLLASAKPKAIFKKNIVFGIPEALVYTHTFTVSLSEGDDLEEVVRKELVVNIPEDIFDLHYSYRVLQKTKDGRQVVVVCANSEAVKEWKDFFKKNDFDVSVFDTEILATYRGLDRSKEADGSAVAVVDIGSATTHIGCLDALGLRLSVTLNLAGTDFDRALAEELKISVKKGEEFKIKNGLIGKDKKAAKILSEQVDELSGDIAKSFDYFAHVFTKKITGVILVGGGARMAGLEAYLSKTLKLPVSVGKLDPDADADWEYLEAVGLAMRNLDKKWTERDPEIPMIFASKNYRPAAGVPVRRKLGVASVGESEAVVSGRLSEVPKFMDKNKGEKILLLVLFLGMILFGVAYWYRGYYRTQQVAQIQKYAADYGVVQTFDLRVPIAVTPSVYTPDQVRGRIVEFLVTSTSNYEEALRLSSVSAQQTLTSNEAIFSAPVSFVSTTTPSMVFAFGWLIYNTAEADQLLIKGVNELNTQKITYFIQSIERAGWEKTDNPAIIYLKGRVTVQSKELF